MVRIGIEITVHLFRYYYGLPSPFLLLPSIMSAKSSGLSVCVSTSPVKKSKGIL